MEDGDLMKTTKQLEHAHPGNVDRTTARPTSSTRKNMPQTRQFSSVQLPSGAYVNVAVDRAVMDEGGGEDAGKEEGIDVNGRVRIDEIDPRLAQPVVLHVGGSIIDSGSGWTAVKPGRYRNNDAPWAMQHKPSVGITPAAAAGAPAKNNPAVPTGDPRAGSVDDVTTIAHKKHAKWISAGSSETQAEILRRMTHNS